jgi:hypothetical protein
MVRSWLTIAALLGLAGCAISPPPSPADQAEAASCTAQADAVYTDNNEDALSRTSQTGLLFAPTPNHAFDSQRLGSLHQRDSQITACEQNGDLAGNGGLPPADIVPPRIVTTP